MADCLWNGYAISDVLSAIRITYRLNLGIVSVIGGYFNERVLLALFQYVKSPLMYSSFFKI